MFAPWRSHNPVRITKSPITGKSSILEANVANLTRLSRKHFDSTHSPNFSVFYKHSVFPKKNCHLTPLPSHNGRHSTTATFFCPQGGHLRRGSTVQHIPCLGQTLAKLCTLFRTCQICYFSRVRWINRWSRVTSMQQERLFVKKESLFSSTHSFFYFVFTIIWKTKNSISHT